MVYPGDLMMLTGAIRDLHLAHPNKFVTDVDTTCRELWDNNPHVTSFERYESHRYLNLGYPRYSHSEIRPAHLATRYHGQLSEALGVHVPLTRACPVIYLNEDERDPHYPRSLGLSKPYWVVVAGAKYDTTTKWWNPRFYQAVVDELDGAVDFVQCGSSDDWHLPVAGAVNMVGNTGLRDLIRLIYHADGVLCPVTFAMHLAAAVPTPDGRPRACVVLVGGRETPALIQYPNHTLLHVIGQLECCRTIGCWRYVCQETHVRQHLSSRCCQPVQITPELKLPRCMEMITPQRVVDAILQYYPDRRPVSSRSAWNCGIHDAGIHRSGTESAKRFGYTHPRHLQELYENAGGANVFRRAVRGAEDLSKLLAQSPGIELLLIGNLMDDTREVTKFCEERGIDRVYGEFGWFPHYSTDHADPWGYAWESSLCTATFARVTAKQRETVRQFRERFLVRPSAPLPERVRAPFVLWPLQLLTDRMNRYDLDVPDWYDLLLWTRQILPSRVQLVIKHHPVKTEQPRLEHARCFPNTVILDKGTPLRPLLEQAAGVIGCNSTVLLEARLLFRKPTWAYGRSWYSGHSDLIFPVQRGERLPHSELLGTAMDDPAAVAYADWFCWQLLARQYSTSDARKNPQAFLQWLHRRTAKSYEALGEDAFN